MKHRILDLTGPVKLTRDDGSTVTYPAGRAVAVEARDADHWFVQIHVAKAPPPALGDFEYARALRRKADEKLAAYREADEQAREAEAAYAAKGAPPAAEEAADQDEDQDQDQDPAGPGAREEEGDEAAPAPASPGEPTPAEPPPPPVEPPPPAPQTRAGSGRRRLGGGAPTA